ADGRTPKALSRMTRIRRKLHGPLALQLLTADHSTCIVNSSRREQQENRSERRGAWVQNSKETQTAVDPCCFRGIRVIRVEALCCSRLLFSALSAVLWQSSA
ncbi:hypothetical protein, partial [Gemmatimonas sp. UBA7669]|uniref:hypothetical protein n=1 Tax=Gemmatimonas sp. UBA7669 TaxID=1946568 RepID=UPI0025C5CD19